jgi:hypothetical protein
MCVSLVKFGHVCGRQEAIWQGMSVFWPLFHGFQIPQGEVWIFGDDLRCSRAQSIGIDAFYDVCKFCEVWRCLGEIGIRTVFFGLQLS